ncbi:MAG TPA: NAD-dependent epimerase/dehydratase family protein [Bryobacteraceae bacterium]|nr:NAD-dependent epimerase/dehydratase family protein [Bryobacteraceae bacterium]
MYKGRRVLVTGGLGFIGSNVTVRLALEGAHVTVVDSMVAGCGANRFNIEPVRDLVSVVVADIAETDAFRDELAGAEIIFNLAGEISHTASMDDPERDLRLNALSNLLFLNACRFACPGVRIVYASTRQVYGKPAYLPVDERHPIEPIDFNGVNKYAASQYHMLLSRRREITAVILRLSNVYGPRMALNIPQQGFLATYFRNALTGEPLLVYGDGSQVRDPVYVDDAVNAFLLAGAAPPSCPVFNIGGAEQLSLQTIASEIARLSGGLSVRNAPFPEALRSIDIGSYWSDTTLARTHLGWTPMTLFRDGISRTLEYYRTHCDHYPRFAAAPETPGSATGGRTALSRTGVR